MRVGTVSFSVPAEDVEGARRALEQAHATIGPFEVAEISDLGKVALVGAGDASAPGVTARMFRTLADQQINLRMIFPDLADHHLGLYPAATSTAGSGRCRTRSVVGLG